MATSRDKDTKEQLSGNVPMKTASSASAPARGQSLSTGEGWDPFRRIRDEFDHKLSQFSRGWNPSWRESLGRAWQWGLDVHEEDDAITVRAEAPGFEPHDFDIQVRGDQLILRATHKSESKAENGCSHEW